MFRLRSSHFVWALITVFFVIACYMYSLIISIPTNFPVGKNFTVEENETLKSMSIRLEKNHYVNSALLFRSFISLRGHDRDIKAGGYIFDEPYGLGNIIEKFVTGHPDVPLVSVTIPEGSTLNEIAFLVHKAIPAIQIEMFVAQAEEKGLAGRLFPSTYFLLPSSTTDTIIKIMQSTFETKYDIFVRGLVIPKPLVDTNQVVSLAAILEGEAKTKEDMEIVAGILLARLQKGIALQVDTAPETYKKKGLPLIPINNPGEVAISAVFNATTSPYFYYITGKDGLMHYAKTFEEHKKNIQKYLK